MLKQRNLLLFFYGPEGLILPGLDRWRPLGSKFCEKSALWPDSSFSKRDRDSFTGKSAFNIKTIRKEN